MSSKRPRLCPVTLRWVADNNAKLAKSADRLAKRCAYSRELERMHERTASRHRDRAKWLRNLATREERACREEAADRDEANRAASNNALIVAWTREEEKK